MNLRKEPVLFVVALACGAYLWSTHEVPKIPDRLRVTGKSYEPLAETHVVLAASDANPPLPKHDLFREPTESSPLPPTDLPFPALSSIPAVVPPLEPGQEAGAWHQLRIPGGPPTPHVFATDRANVPDDQDPNDTGGGAANGNGLPAAVAQNQDAIPKEELVRRFDRVRVKNISQPLYGYIRNRDPDKYTLVEQFQKSIKTTDVLFERVRITDGRSFSSTPEPIAIDTVEKIELADNLENRIEIRRRGITRGQAGVPDRIAFLRDLLDEARQQPWVYGEAEKQARAIVDATSGAEVGYRWVMRVLRAQGDLARELELYGSLPQELAESPFRYRNLGELEARLSLWADAETHLRKAVELSPNDPRSLGALARYLLGRGRASEAMPHAELAARNILQVDEAEERYRLAETLIAGYLALGRLDDASQALAQLGSANGNAARTYLRGAVAYAQALQAKTPQEQIHNVERATEMFARAASEGTSLEPVLGLGQCHLLSGVLAAARDDEESATTAWDGAKTNLEQVRDEAPILRHRALAALALLYERTGHAQRALESVEEAVRVHPGDPYALYLLGRQQRLAGDLEAAVQTLRKALQLRDDMTAAYAETSMALYAMHAEREAASDDHLAGAARFAGRLVELDASRGRSLAFVELFGFLLFQLGDTNASRAAFNDGADRGSGFCQLALALLDYRQKRGTEAREELAEIESDPGRDAAMREFARVTLGLIDDHASKEQVRDAFDRSQLGGLWDTVGQHTVRIVDAALSIKSPRRGGRTTEGAARRGVRASHFLRVEVTMTVEGDLDSTEQAGLRLVRDGRSGQPFSLTLGLDRSTGRIVPALMLIDGTSREDEKQEPKLLEAALGPVDFKEPQRFAVEVTPVGDAGARFALSVYWNDHLVHSAEGLRALTPRNTWTLWTDLYAEGPQVDVVFDDYRLVRRKEG